MVAEAVVDQFGPRPTSGARPNVNGVLLKFAPTVAPLVIADALKAVLDGQILFLLNGHKRDHAQGCGFVKGIFFLEETTLKIFESSTTTGLTPQFKTHPP